MLENEKLQITLQNLTASYKMQDVARTINTMTQFSQHLRHISRGKIVQNAKAYIDGDW